MWWSWEQLPILNIYLYPYKFHPYNIESIIMSVKTITFIVPVCSRGQSWKTIDDAPIINTCLKSIKDTVSAENHENYDFEILIGYDDDDAFFIQSHHIDAIEKRVMECGFVFGAYAFDNTKNNPVQCWNNLAKIAVDGGSDYLYQTGDDVELQTPGWVDAFVSALESTGNVGVAAPKDLGYHGLYTQSFVHRTHIDIMESYYPTAFRSWYCDNAITDMYQPDYNHYLEDYHIKNTGGPQRYNAHDAQPILVEEVAKAQVKLYNKLAPDMDDEEKQILLDRMETVHKKYEQISKTMTTAPAKPIWAAATKIWAGIMEIDKNG